MLGGGRRFEGGHMDVYGAGIWPLGGRGFPLRNLTEFSEAIGWTVVECSIPQDGSEGGSEGGSEFGGVEGDVYLDFCG